MTGWQAFDDVRPDHLTLYFAWNTHEPEIAPWPVHVSCHLFVSRAATHWHALVMPEPPQKEKRAS